MEPQYYEGGGFFRRYYESALPQTLLGISAVGAEALGTVFDAPEKASGKRYKWDPSIPNKQNLARSKIYRDYRTPQTKQLLDQAKLINPNFKFYERGGKGVMDRMIMNSLSDVRDGFGVNTGGVGNLAKQIGRVEQMKNPLYRQLGSRLGSISKGALGIGAFLPASTLPFVDERTAGMITNAQTLMSLPAIAEELDAARRGSRFIANTSKYRNAGRIAQLAMRARPFASAPALALTAAIPYYTYKHLKDKKQLKGTY